MAVKKHKYYVVWAGLSPGVYDSWAECQLQISGVPGARYKSYATLDEAVEAYRGDPDEQLGIIRSIIKHTSVPKPAAVPGGSGPGYWATLPGVRMDAIAVDGACAGNPGRMEYRAVRLIDGAEVFRIGATQPLTGTNNIAEYLAMIHLAALLAKSGDTRTPIYTDSKNTLAWLRKGRSNTSLEENERTAPVLALLRRADEWLARFGPIRNPILKWRTEEWGEIPADFGRK
ncbi:MAG: ribonuclease H family protein [Muribaculaceae bacterium]|nr:ribonuclease H family protein [Muribaculaceae bacterium]